MLDRKGRINVEILLPPRRADRVYKIVPVNSEDSEEEILHVEYEVSPNMRMDKRLLVYHSFFYEKHELPITSVLVYPFELTGMRPPLIEMRRGKKVLQFDYETVELWKWDARSFVAKKAVPLYGLLPTMDGTSDDLLLQAIDEMVQYYQNDEEHLRDELLCFRTMLNRAQRLPESEIAYIDRRIRMFDPLLEEDPWVKEKVAEGEAREKLRSWREALQAVVSSRFPALSELAETRAGQIARPDRLNVLLVEMSVAKDERDARAILEQFNG